MGRKLLIRDLTLRDGQQSQLATRMNQTQIDSLLPIYRDANFYAMEVWGGAVPDSAMRFLDENPWERLSKIKQVIGGKSKLTALSRGRNLFGYNPYPDDVIDGFCKHAVQTGVDIMRIFDALNDTNNMLATIKSVKKYGGQADCAVCYTVDPSYSLWFKLKRIMEGKTLPPKLFTPDYFVNKAKILETAGADMISIKDMAGLIDPASTAVLIDKLKKELKIPVDLHTHCTPGYGLASVLMGIIHGVDIVDTVIMNFSQGPAAPSIELVQIFADKLGVETNLNMQAIEKINKELFHIRGELKAFDQLKKIPMQFSYTNDQLPKKVHQLFDEAILAANDNKIDTLLDRTHKIEKYFGFPLPDTKVQKAEIPGGMYSNMISQLENLKVPELFNDVLKAIPRVRLDSGLIPLVTPTSQIVGAQAVSSVIQESKGNPFYSQASTQFKNLVMGKYGKTPYPIDPEFRKLITGSKDEIPYEVEKYEHAENMMIEEIGVMLCEDEKEQLLLELFPAVAKDFLKKQKMARFESIQVQKVHQDYQSMVDGLKGNYQI